VLIELFDKIKGFFARLTIYTEVPSTPELTTVMGKTMAEVLYMLAIATKEMKQGRTSAFIFRARLPLTFKFEQKHFLRNWLDDPISRTRY
jgi:hypothetical protein